MARGASRIRRRLDKHAVAHGCRRLRFRTGQAKPILNVSVAPAAIGPGWVHFFGVPSGMSKERRARRRVRRHDRKSPSPVGVSTRVIGPVGVAPSFLSVTLNSQTGGARAIGRHRLFEERETVALRYGVACDFLRLDRNDGASLRCVSSADWRGSRAGRRHRYVSAEPARPLEVRRAGTPAPPFAASCVLQASRCSLRACAAEAKNFSLGLLSTFPFLLRQVSRKDRRAARQGTLALNSWPDHALTGERLAARLNGSVACLAVAQLIETGGILLV